MSADRETCERCGTIRRSSDLATINTVRFCHGVDDSSPTCYEFAQRLGVPEVDVLVTMPAMRVRLDALLARQGVPDA